MIFSRKSSGSRYGALYCILHKRHKVIGLGSARIVFKFLIITFFSSSFMFPQHPQIKDVLVSKKQEAKMKALVIIRLNIRISFHKETSFPFG